MKIVCESCNAKYSIADAKVAGRTLKIRCKHCAAAIVVRGAAPAASADKEAIWHVIVAGQEQGPMSEKRIGELIASGAIGWDAYVWREGYDDWKQAQDVDELLGGLATDAGPNPFASESPPAQSELTGTRNESSVLFSLSNLKGLATSVPSKKSVEEPKPARTAAPRDGSGLIDIRALAAVSGAPSSPAPKSEVKVDELLSIGSIGIATSLGAPVLVPEKKAETSKKTAIAVGSSIFAILAAAAAVIVVVATQPSAPIAVNEPLVATHPVPTTPQRVEPPTTPQETALVRTEPTTEPIASTPLTKLRTPRRPRVETETAPERTTPEPRNNTVESVLSEVLEPRTRTERPEPVADNAPPTPTRNDVVGAMNSVAGAVRACGEDGSHGLAPVSVVFGNDGRVANASVTSATLPPDVKSCVARAVRDARVPRFAQSSFRVNYPFRI